MKALSIVKDELNTNIGSQYAKKILLSLAIPQRKQDRVKDDDYARGMDALPGKLALALGHDAGDAGCGNQRDEKDDIDPYGGFARLGRIGAAALGRDRNCKFAETGGIEVNTVLVGGAFDLFNSGCFQFCQLIVIKINVYKCEKTDRGQTE